MKEKRNLSGIYFRAKNENTGKYDNIVFEDLTEGQQDEILNSKDIEWIKSLSKMLANTINRIGESTDIFAE